MMLRTFFFLLLLAFVFALIVEFCLYFFAPKFSYFRARIERKRYDSNVDSLQKQKKLWEKK